MKLSESVKPISYLKAHMSEVVNDIVAEQKTMFITQNGEAKVVLQDLKVFEETQESLAMLKIMALSNKSMNEGKVKPAAKAFEDIRKKAKGL